MLPDVNKIIQKLKAEENTIYFITARLINIEGCDSEAITKKSLKDFNIPQDYLYVGISDKLTFFKEHGIDIYIEDSYETCREFTNDGIKSILMTTKMNKEIDNGEFQELIIGQKFIMKSKNLKIYNIFKTIRMKFKIKMSSFLFFHI